MHSFLEFSVSRIEQLNPLHFKKVRKNLKKLAAEPGFNKYADDFFTMYDHFLGRIGRSREYAVDSYLQMISDMVHETIEFQETGKYSSTSFDEVNKRVYNNPLIMEYYMHGLLMSQFLWQHHYVVFKFFIDNMPNYKEMVGNYLEVGGGHGLYVNEAIKAFGGKVNYNVLDISESSLEMARHFVNSDKVNFILSDIFKYQPSVKYDFITMGEVLEHVEDPKALLKRLGELLAPKGTIFITTPTNAPTIDHLYLFRNAEEIRELIHQAGFSIEKEIKAYAEDVPEELAEQLKITLIYAAFITKTKD